MIRYDAVNWNKPTNDYNLRFWEQNIKQFWIEKEINVGNDTNVWNQLNLAQQRVFKRALAGLTLLDTRQGGEGMTLIALHTEDLQAKAVLTFMGAMEQIHAKSYSYIFTTLISEAENDELMKWVKEEPLLNKKADIIVGYYKKIFKPKITKKELYMAIVASVFLESFLFYSGFYYPLYLAGQGKMTASGEIINLILRDESIHGVFTGLLAQELFNSFSPEEQEKIERQVIRLLKKLYKNEVEYTKLLYTEIGLEEDVEKFLRYNANRAMMNLGYEPYFDEDKINPIVENGLRTQTKNHDFFSVKGNSYFVPINVEELEDSDFQ